MARDDRRRSGMSGALESIAGLRILIVEDEALIVEEMADRPTPCANRKVLVMIISLFAVLCRLTVSASRYLAGV